MGPGDGGADAPHLVVERQLVVVRRRAQDVGQPAGPHGAFHERPTDRVLGQASPERRPLLSRVGQLPWPVGPPLGQNTEGRVRGPAGVIVALAEKLIAPDVH
ncbi:hypothetical protein AB0J82_36255 [Asanoa sp. NPDC049518]|uniref:hypothetical protein n=1 Tax=unclassified Asanoa TaxID=2685164 RepID=UPI0034464F4B